MYSTLIDRFLVDFLNGLHIVEFLQFLPQMLGLLLVVVLLDLGEQFLALGQEHIVGLILDVGCFGQGL